MTRSAGPIASPARDYVLGFALFWVLLFPLGFGGFSGAYVNALVVQVVLMLIFGARMHWLWLISVAITAAMAAVEVLGGAGLGWEQREFARLFLFGFLLVDTRGVDADRVMQTF